MSQGNLYILSAPSGAGKSSLISALLEKNQGTKKMVSISHTTRSPRPGESHGVHYYFVSVEEFERLIEKGHFLEYAKVFGGNYYGTSLPAIEENLAKGIDVFLDIDWQGAQQIRQKVPSVKSIFILPPSLPELERRLIGRGQDSKDSVECAVGRWRIGPERRIVQWRRSCLALGDFGQNERGNRRRFSLQTDVRGQKDKCQGPDSIKRV